MSNELPFVKVSWYKPGRSARARSKVFPKGKVLSVGRGANQDVVLNDSHVSRSHARIMILDDAIGIEDLQSENGTFIDGKRVTSGKCRAGQTLQIGPYCFSFKTQARAAPRPVPTWGRSIGLPRSVRRLAIPALSLIAVVAALLIALWQAGWPGLGPGPKRISTVPDAFAPQPFYQALRDAVGAVLNFPQRPEKVDIMIDPLIHGISGVEVAQTRSMARMVADLIHDIYPSFNVVPFSASNIAMLPFVFIGTLTPVNSKGQATGPKDAYRICLALFDLGARRVVGKGRAFAQLEKIDPTPTPFFGDSPLFSRDEPIDAYLKGCHATKPGDPIPAGYHERLKTERPIQQAIADYEAGRYRDAAGLFSKLTAEPGGNQVRVFNGLYISNLKLERRQQAAAAFDRFIEFGLAKGDFNLLTVGETRRGAQVDEVSRWPQEWAKQIAMHLSAKPSLCLDIVAHSSRMVDDERITLARAQNIRDQIVKEAPELSRRVRARGSGATELLIGTGDGVSDALDRRSEFKVVGCS